MPLSSTITIKLKDGSCDALAADLSRRGVPLVIFSRYNDQRDASSTDQKARWLTKPIHFPALLTALQEQMGERA